MKPGRLRKVPNPAGDASASPDALCSPEDGGPAGESEFVDHLFNEYREAVFRFLLRKQCTAADADDILQETYLRVVNSANLEPLQARARNYIFTVAINIWRDRLRSEGTRRRLEQTYLAEPAPASAASQPEKLALRGQEVEAVKLCLLDLPERPRSVFLLRAVEHHSFVDIAGMLQVSVKTVHRDYRLALDCCKRALKEWESGHHHG